MEQPRGALAAWLVFLIVPLAITGMSLAKGHEWRQRAARQDLRFQLRQEARRLLARADPPALILEHFARRVTPGMWPAELILTAPGPSTGTAPTSLLPLLTFFTGGQVLEGTSREELRQLLGWETNLENLRDQPNHPLPVRWGRYPAWLIWERVTPPGVAATPSLRLSLYRAPDAFWRVSQVMRLANLPSGWAAAAVDRRTRRWTSRHQPDLDRVREALRRSRPPVARQRTSQHHPRRSLATAGPSSNLSSPGPAILGNLPSLRGSPGATAHPEPDEGQETVLTHLEEAGGDVALILEAPVPGWPSDRFQWWLWSGLAGLTLGLSLAWRSLTQVWSSAPLRTKFLGIFGYAVGLPLLGVAVLAQGMLADRRETRIQETFLAAREALLAFDDGFRVEEAETARRFRQVLKLPALATGNLPAVTRRLRWLMDEGWIDRAEVRSWETTPLINLERGRPDPGFGIFTEMMSRNAIQAFVGPGRTRFAHESMVHFMANAVLETPELGFVEITRKPEKLQLFRFGPSLFYWFWTLQRDLKSPWAFLSLTRSHHQAARRYLERHLLRNRPFRLVAWDRQTGRWLPDIRSPEGLTALISGLARTGEDQVARLAIRGRPFLAFAMPGHRLARFDLLALTAEDDILREPRRVMEAVAGGVGIALLAGVLCALLLADSLLVPLENLGQGVRALSRRDSEHRIPVRSADEMGHLAGAFNHMLETVGEIDLAKVVQDCLVPATPPSPAGYRTDLRMARVMSIGGVYFDHLALSDGRQIILTGDVAGHGVGAGLVMAMAKAVVFQHFASQGGPESLLPRLGTTLRDLIPTRRMMSMCLLCLDSLAHTLQFWLAGHTAPLLWRNSTRQIETHRQPSHPLGFRKQRISQGPPMHLEPGDLLLVFSDEIFQCFGAGSPSLAERLAALAPGGPTTVVQGMAEAVDAVPPERRDRDDWAILALQRLEASR